MNSRTFFLPMVALLSGFSSARTVSVTSFDRTTGSVELSIEAGAQGAADQALLAAWNPRDAGTAATNWRASVSVAAVSAATTSASFTVPAEWRAASGVVRFFLMERTAPYAARFDCITGQPGPWIDTGVIPTADTDIRVTATHPQDMAPFGVAQAFYLFSNTPDMSSATPFYYYGFFGVSGSVSGAPRGSAPREHRLNATGVYVDGERYAAFDPSGFADTAVNYSLTLFGRRDNGTGAIGKQQGDCAIYSAQIEQNGELVRQYVPCLSPEGTVTLYDRVAQTFCAVSGTGAFTAGTEVGPDPQDCGTVESCTEPLVFAPSLSAGMRNLVTGEVTVNIAGAHDAGVLMVVAAETDAGTTLPGWAERMFATKVAADQTQVTMVLPSAWWNLGRTVRFIWTSADGFDYDYELDSLRTAGSAYVDTGWIVTPQTEVEVCGKSGVDICHFGILTYFYLFTNGGNTFWGFFGRNGSFSAYAPADGFHTLRLGPSGAWLDGMLKASFTTPVYTGIAKTLPIPFRRDGSSGSLSKCGTCQIRSAKMWERGTLVRDFVPCVKDGVAGLYDRVHGVFRGSCVAEPFDVGEPGCSLVEGEALAWSDAVSLALTSGAAVWDGGGGDTSVRTAANWENDAVPDLSSGEGSLVFAAAGTRASVSGDVSVHDVRFNAKSDFSLDAAGGDALLRIGLGGIMLEDDPSETISDVWRYCSVQSPLAVTAGQTWDLSANKKRRLQLDAGADLQGAAGVAVTVTGAGCLGLAATNSFAGDFRLQGGNVKVFSKQRPFGTSAEGGKVYLDIMSGAVFEMIGGVMDKPLAVTGGTVSSEFFWLIAGAGTNYFTAPLSLTGGALSIRANGPAAFSGGMSLENDLIFTSTGGNRGDLVFCGEPVVSTGSFEFWSTREIHFHSPSNHVGLNFDGKWSGLGNTVHCWTDYAFHDYGSWLTLKNSTTVNLHGHSQNFADVKMLDADSRVTSETPAEFFAFNNGMNDTAFKGTFEGQVNLAKSGGRTVTLDNLSTTTGYLLVQNGPLVISANGCWTGTEVMVGRPRSNRKPSLRLTHDACFADPRHTKLTLITSTSEQIYTDDVIPVVEIDEGVRHVFAEIWLDGRRLAGGTWGSSSSSARHKDDQHFAGRGVLQVPGGGLAVIFR